MNQLSERYDQLLKHIGELSELKFKDKVPQDIYNLIEELQTYQVELEHQNEEFQNKQKELSNLQNKYVDFYNSLPIGIFILNKDRLITEINSKGISLLNTKKENIISTAFVFFLADNSQIKFSRYTKEILKTQEAHECELEFIRPDGTHFHANTKIKPIFGVDNINQLQITLIDIEEDAAQEEHNQKLLDQLNQVRKDPKDSNEISIKELLNLTRQFAYELEVTNDELRATTNKLNIANEKLQNQGEKLARLNHTLRALSDSDHAMIHAKDETEYLDEVCRIIIEDCGHAMVWIGYTEGDEDKTVRPVAQYGFDEGYIENLNITWADTKRGRGPTGTAIRTGKHSICKNMLTDPDFEPWREEAIKRGYASSIVFPLIADNKTLGAISIYSREPDSFLDEEVKLLAELADDLAFGITNLRLQAAHDKAVKELRKSEEGYRIILETANSGVFLLDAENKIKYLNQHTIELLGYSVQEMLDVSLTQFVDTIGQKNIHKFMNQWKKGHNALNEFKFIRKDGSTFWTLLAASPILDNKGKYLGTIGVITDINARKGLEKALMDRERISKSILYDMMGMINRLMKEESENEYFDIFEGKYEYN